MLTALGAEKFAEIDPEEFFNFAQERPRSTRSKDGIRHLQWPANEFYLWPGSDAAPPVVFYLGTEPHLKWRTFSSLVGDLARQCGVKSVVHIGALLDAVPHTRVTKFSGTSTNRRTQAAFDRANVRTSNYQGPSGITLPVSESLAARGISYTSLWGHVSHYLHATPNFRVGLGLAQNLSDILGLPVDLGKLTVMAEAFDREVEKVIADDDQAWPIHRHAGREVRRRCRRYGNARPRRLGSRPGAVLAGRANGRRRELTDRPRSMSIYGPRAAE